MTPEIRRLAERRERLMAERARMPEDGRAAIDAEIGAVSDQLARRLAIAQNATEQPGAGFAEWVDTPADTPGAGPEVVDLRGGKTIEDHLRERDRRVPRWPPDAA